MTDMPFTKIARRTHDWDIFLLTICIKASVRIAKLVGTTCLALKILNLCLVSLRNMITISFSAR